MKRLEHERGDSRIGLVLRVNSRDAGSKEFCEVLLIHTAPELACSCDAVVPGQVASTPYDVVVQTDLRAVVWTLQLGHKIGRLATDAIATIGSITLYGLTERRSSDEVDAKTEIYRGTRLAGPIDRRWDFKKSEGKTLRQLASDCTATLLDEDPHWRVDFRLLDPEAAHSTDEHHAWMAELLHWERTRTLFVDQDDLHSLKASGALEVESWRAMSDIGTDLWMSFTPLIERSATCAAVTSTSRDIQSLVTASTLAHHIELESIDRIEYLGAKELTAV